MADDWKQTHADEAAHAVLHPHVREVMEEFADNMGFKFDGLPKYGLLKIANVVAQVARAHALGFDPELLKLTPEEANAQLLAKARAAVAAGKPALVIRGDDVQRID